jgi:hypothetical protein
MSNTLFGSSVPTQTTSSTNSSISSRPTASFQSTTPQSIPNSFMPASAGNDCNGSPLSATKPYRLSSSFAWHNLSPMSLASLMRCPRTNGRTAGNTVDQNEALGLASPSLSFVDTGPLQSGFSLSMDSFLARLLKDH